MMEHPKRPHSPTHSSSIISKKQRSEVEDSNVTDIFHTVLSFVEDESADAKFVK